MSIILKTITIDGKTYALEEIGSPESRRLIISLIRSEKEIAQRSREILEARSRALEVAFAKIFPGAASFRETAYVHRAEGEWKYVFVGIHGDFEKLIEWAKQAQSCGLIDAYIVDYDPKEVLK